MPHSVTKDYELWIGFTTCKVATYKVDLNPYRQVLTLISQFLNIFLTLKVDMAGYFTLVLSKISTNYHIIVIQRQ